ncbi:MAG: C40 family peptidase [Niabella sp.]
MVAIRIICGVLVSTFLVSCSTVSGLSSSVRNQKEKSSLVSADMAAASVKPMQQATVSARNLKSDTRLERISQVVSEKQDIQEVNFQEKSVMQARLHTTASWLQQKYGNMLNIMPTSLSNLNLLETIDEWYGTRYRYGGTTKSGIDCSAFVRTLFDEVYKVALPRTAREQYGVARRIPATELREGDLVFFNTRGGVSHVGIYLRNNKFVHSSTSKGVTISDMFDSYYMRHFIGGGRIEKPDQVAYNNNN